MQKISHLKNQAYKDGERKCFEYNFSNVFITDPIIYELVDLKGEKIAGKFYREELQVI